MALMIDFRVVELLCSRICHDLISPVGAINNGIELIEELGSSVVDEAIGLIDGSAKKLSHHLKFYRMAYGLAGSQSIKSFEEVHGLVEGMLHGGKIRFAWSDSTLPSAAPAPGWGKFLLNLVALAAEGLPRGGTLEVAVASPPGTRSLRVIARGTDAGLSDALTATLDTKIAIESLDVRTVHAYFATLLAERLGVRIELASSADRFEVVAAIAEGE